MCNMVVIKCLLDRKEWKPKIYFRSKMIFEEGRELKMVRSMKVMKDKDRHREKGLQQHCGK